MVYTSQPSPMLRSKHPPFRLPVLQHYYQDLPGSSNENTTTAEHVGKDLRTASAHLHPCSQTVNPSCI